ncbi:MAG: hypothetical protein ABI877_04135 [Gemmatimonadaceae bacterium]
MRPSSGLSLLVSAASLLAVGTLGAPWFPIAGRFGGGGHQLFQTSDACMACHNGLVTPSGEDVSIGSTWRATIMANSARDPYWQASVRREVLDHPGVRSEIEDECSKCHMPMMRRQAHADGERGEVLSRLPLGRSQEPLDLLAADGVSCTVCHQIMPDKLGLPESFVGGFVIDSTTPFGQRVVFGPFEVDAGRQRIMHSSSEFQATTGLHIRESSLCATCHTLFTEARDSSGKVIGRLPEQVPFLEWQASDYATEGNSQSCQSCHMPVVTDSVAISSVWGMPRKGLARHEFRGGNFLMLRMLSRYRTELAVDALPSELELAARRTVDHLANETARMTLQGVRLDRAEGRLLADVVIRNLTGHKLPTGYPSRRAWLHVVVRDRSDRIVFESGSLAANGSIVGNDNDADATKFEPHYRDVHSSEEVQIYESIMADAKGLPTTGLLSAVRFVKDNRLLPLGFVKKGASQDIAVQGTAMEDGDFGEGSDRVRYAVSVTPGDAPFRVQAELLFQPIAYRWARNLSTVPASEAQRFVSYYEAMSAGSATQLGVDSATVR